MLHELATALEPAGNEFTFRFGEHGWTRSNASRSLLGIAGDHSGPIYAELCSRESGGIVAVMGAG